MGLHNIWHFRTICADIFCAGFDQYFDLPHKDNLSTSKANLLFFSQKAENSVRLYHLEWIEVDYVSVSAKNPH